MDENVRQLPRGRHGLAREEVVASQRGRMTVAVLDAVALHGYSATTVAHVVKGARVSRETFYEHFSSKDECYLAAVGAAINDLRGHTAQAMDSSPDPLECLDAFLRTYLEWLAARPAVARCLLLELRSAGPDTIARDEEATSALVDSIMRRLNSDDHFACELFVAALRQLVAQRVGSGRTAMLGELREPLLRVVARYDRGVRVPA